MQLLDPQPGQVVLDCTVGRGGHGAMLIPKLGQASGGGGGGGGRYIGLDMDPGNVAFSRDRLGPIAETAGVSLDVIHANFRDARGVWEIASAKRPGGTLGGPVPPARWWYLSAQFGVVRQFSGRSVG